MRRFIILSFALHFLLVGLSFVLRQRTFPHSEPEAVMIDLPAPEAEPSAGPPASTSKRAQHDTVSPAKPLLHAEPSFSDLAPRHAETFRPVRPGEITTAAPAPDAFSPYAASDDIFAGAAETSGALAWVYNKAERTIGFPLPFIRHDITGNATARLVFDSTGKLKPELLHVQGDSPYLRVYVYRTLENAFARDRVPADLVRWKDTLEVFCFVKFSFTETTEVKVAGTSIMGNKLFFARHTVKSSVEKLKWNLGPIHGLLPVPVVGVDMTWFYRKYQDAKHPLRAQAEADDLAPWRKDPLFNQI